MVLVKAKRQQQIYLLLIALTCQLVGTLNAFMEFGGAVADLQRELGPVGIIDTEMKKIRKDGRDPDTTSVFEEMR